MAFTQGYTDPTRREADVLSHWLRRLSPKTPRHATSRSDRGWKPSPTWTAKRWPTFVFLQDGKKVARVVRPFNADVTGRCLK